MGITRSVVEIELAMKGQAALKSGMEGSGSSAKSLAGHLTTATNALKRMEQQQSALGQSTRLTQMQITNLGYQLNDIATGLASGQSPFRVLAQQGGQVYQALSMGPGGVGGALAAIRNMLPGLATRFAPVAAAAGAVAIAYQGIRASLAAANEASATASLGERNKDFAAGLQKSIADQEKRGILSPERAQQLRAQVSGAIAQMPGADGLDISTPAEEDQAGFARSMNVLPNKKATAYNPGDQATMLSRVAKELYENLNLLTDAQQKAVYKANEMKAKADDDYRRAKITRDESALEAQLQNEEITADEFAERKRLLAIESNTVTMDALTRQEEQLNQDILDLADDKDKQKAKAQRIALEGELAANKTMRLAAEEELMTELARIDQGQQEAMFKADEEAIKEHNRKMEEAQRAQEKADREHKAALEEQLRLNRHIFELKMATIENDFRLTQAQKYGQQTDTLNDARMNGTISQEEFDKNMSQLGPNPTSFLDQLQAKIAAVKDSWGTLQQQMATGVINMVTDSVSGLSGALTSVIMGTKSAGAAFAQFGIQLLTNFISMILQAILWATVAIPILTALGILSGGATAAQGAAVTGMALGAGASMAGAIVGGRALGGSVVPGLPYIVGEKRPELFIPDTGGRIIPQVDSEAMGGGSGGGGGGRNGTVVYVVSNHDEALRDAAQRGVLNPLIVNSVRSQRTKLGMKG